MANGQADERAVRTPSAASFVGRERELATVAAALRDPSAVIAVEGEAGVGKTRLVAEALGVLAAPRVLNVSCPPLADPYPLGPVIDALHHVDVAGLSLSPLAGALRPLFPEWQDLLPPTPEDSGDPVAVRHLQLRALVELVRALGPDVVVVDDAHGADPVTVDLLLLLASATAQCPLVLTYRPTELGTDAALRRLTGRTSGAGAVHRVALDSFGLDETAALIKATFAVDRVSREFVTLLHDGTGGLPLAVEQTLRLMRERGDIVPADVGWARRELADLRVPPSVRDSVLERVQRLDAPARTLLEAAAVLAAPAPEPQLAHVAGLDQASARDALTATLDAGLLEETARGAFGFRHQLASRTVAEATNVVTRRHMHGEAAASLLDHRPLSVGRLLRHVRECDAVASWSGRAEAAAEAALEAGDDRAGALLLHALLERPDLPEQHRLPLAHRLAAAAASGVGALGDIGPQLVERVAAVVDQGAEDDPGDPRLGAIRLQLGRLLLQLGEFDAAAERLSEAADVVSEHPVDAAKVMVSLAFPRGRAWSAAQHRAWLRRAGPLLDRVDDGDVRTWLEVDRLSVRLMLGETNAWSEAEDLCASATSPFARRESARMLLNLGHCAIAWGADEQARDSLRRAAERMEETRYLRLFGSVRLTTCLLDWHAGRWSGLADRVLAVAGTDGTLPEAALEAREVLGLLDLAAGRRDEARDHLEYVVEETTRRGVTDGGLLPAAALARLATHEGDPETALELTRAAVDLMAFKDLWLRGAEVAVAHLDALTAADLTDEATAFLRLMEEAMGDGATPMTEVATDVGRGIVEAARNPRAAAVCFAHAAERLTDLPRPYDAALARERQARAELAAGDRVPAIARLADVHRNLLALGARWDADRVGQALRAEGVQASRPWRGGRRGYGTELSPREREAADLVARGLTNRQIAETLFLSTRTIDRHVSAVMRKLDVGSRTAVAVRLLEERTENFG